MDDPSPQARVNGRSKQMSRFELPPPAPLTLII